jgi:acyl carrier protein
MLRVHHPDQDGPSAKEIADWITARLAEALRLPVSEIDIQREWTEFGLDSMRMMSLTSDLVEWLDRDLAADLLWKCPTISLLSKHLAGYEVDIATRRGLVCLRSSGHRPPLILFPPAAIHSSSFQGLTRHLGDDQPVYSVDPLGWNEEEAIPERIEDMAKVYLEWIERELPHGPCFLAGRCVGGLVALEVAQKLQGRGRQIPMLAILDTQNTGIPAETTRLARAKLIAARVLAGSGHRLTSWISKPWSPETPPSEPRVWLMPHHRQLFEASVTASGRYVPRAYGGRCVLLRSEAKPWLNAVSQAVRWRAIGGQNLRIETMPGNHRTFAMGENEVLLARRLRACMDEAWNETPCAQAVSLRRAA